MRKDAIRRPLRPAIILIIAILLFLFTDTLLWIAGLLLALFYFAVDVLNIDKSGSSIASYTELYPAHEKGVLGRYEIDSTESYGLFLSIGEKPVFVDIREDNLIEERRAFAQFLAANTNQLKASLDEFIQAHPEFASRHIAFIGLHAKILDQGEVSWFPEGYTTLKGLEFLA